MAGTLPTQNRYKSSRQNRLLSVAKLSLIYLLLALALYLALLPVNKVLAYSAALGSLVFSIANTIFAIVIFRHSGARAARAIVRDSYYGEALKLLVVALLFSGLFVFVRPFNALGVFGGFIAAQLAHWVASAVIFR